MLRTRREFLRIRSAPRRERVRMCVNLARRPTSVRMDRYGPIKDCSSRKIILPRGQSPPALKEVGWDLEVGHVAQKVAVLRRKQMRPREKMPRAAGVGRPGGLGGPEQTARKSLPGGDLQAPRRASCRARARERRASSPARNRCTDPPRMVIAMAEEEEGFIGKALGARPLPRMVTTAEEEEGIIGGAGRTPPPRMTAARAPTTECAASRGRRRCCCCRRRRHSSRRRRRRRPRAPPPCVVLGGLILIRSQIYTRYDTQTCIAIPSTG